MNAKSPKGSPHLPPASMRELPPAPRLPSNRTSIEGWIGVLAASGYHAFTVDEASQALGGSLARVRLGLSRLAAKGLLIRPAKGLYVLVPVEYQAVGGPPPVWYIDALMRHIGLPYYVGLLSAAAMHGASAQAPQELQVVTTKSLPTKTIGRGRIRWVVKHDMEEDEVLEMPTQTGIVRVSTAETTALGIVRYDRYTGYLDNVATILLDLADKLHPESLARVARRDAVAARRLGYLLDQVGRTDLGNALAASLDVGRRRLFPLDMHAPTDDAAVDAKWGLYVNASIEPD